jgi:hypothetical protein
MLELNTWALVFVIPIIALLIILAAAVLWDVFSLALSEGEAPEHRSEDGCLHPTDHRHDVLSH